MGGPWDDPLDDILLCDNVQRMYHSFENLYHDNRFSRMLKLIKRDGFLDRALSVLGCFVNRLLRPSSLMAQMTASHHADLDSDGRRAIGLQVRVGQALETDIYVYIGDAIHNIQAIRPWCKCAQKVMDHSNELERHRSGAAYRPAYLYALVDMPEARQYVSEYFAYCANISCLYMPPMPQHIAGEELKVLGKSKSYDATFIEWFHFGTMDDAVATVHSSFAGSTFARTRNLPLDGIECRRHTYTSMQP